jgi:hypothetical protein
LIVLACYFHFFIFKKKKNPTPRGFLQVGQLRARLAAKAQAEQSSSSRYSLGRASDHLGASPLHAFVLAANDDVAALRRAAAASTGAAHASGGGAGAGENKGGDDGDSALVLDSAGLAAAAARIEELQVA